MFGLALTLAVGSIGAQDRPAPLDVVQQVRLDLGHGDLDAARRAAYSATGDPADRDLAQALVALFEGKQAEARARLESLAAAQPLGEAAVELGWLDVRTGRVAEGRRRLDPIAAVRTFNSPDDYYRLARAARGIREFLLANDAYQRIVDVPRADIQAEWGDMLLERHRPGDAMTSYRKALEADERWIPAMLGVARALADENPEEAKAALGQAKELAPGHPDVYLVEAELALDAEENDAASAALDEVARLRPGSIEEAALRVALAYDASGLAGVEDAVARVGAIQPTSALGYRRAGEQAAREYRFDDAAALAKKAVAIDPNDSKAQFDLGLYLLRTGDEVLARTALETSWALDNSAPLTKNLLDLLDRLDSFTVVPHGEFIFKFAPEETAVLQAYALPLADEAYKQFVERYGMRPTGPILVEVFDRHDDFAVRTLGLPGLVGALGACFGRVVTMDSPRARPPGDFSWQATLWHELAHVFTLQASEYRVPRWLTEGVSTYEEHRREPAWGRELTLEYAREFGAGRHFGVKKLPEAFKNPRSLALAYFEASLVVEHLVAQSGEAGLRTLLQAYAEGATDPEAFAKAYGQSVDQVDASFNAFIAERYGALSRAMAVPEERDIEATDIEGLKARADANPDNFVSQLSYGQALVRAERMDDAKAPLERAAALAPQASGGGSPRALLAQIAEQEGDTERARREWRALLQYDHTNVVAARRLAVLSSEAGAEDDENFALRLVADLDPFDAGIHGRLGRRLMANGDYDGALVEFQAALALGPTNPAEAHVDVAEAFLKLGQRDEARRAVLAALQVAPTYGRAQDLLLTVSGR
jgi:tetratricopeptide (TPR) repeat protein